jgi:RNAse (barnase) inhibitor barstar
MAMFKEPECYQRLDFALLQNGPIALYYRLEILAADEETLKKLGYAVSVVDTSLLTQEEGLLAHIGRQLAFPAYYGVNLDALNDCLRGIAIPEDGGLLVEFLHFDGMLAQMPEVSRGVLDIFARNARLHLLFGRRLIMAVQSNDPKIAIEPLGGEFPLWNPKEWLNQNRGL